MFSTFQQQLMQIVTDIWFFLKNPKDQKAASSSLSNKLHVLMLILLIDVSITFVIMGLIQLVELMGWHKSNSHAVLEMIRSFPIWAFLILGVLVVPLLEELVFRYGLRFKSRYFGLLITVVLISLGVLAYSLLPLAGAIGIWIIIGVTFVLYALNFNRITGLIKKLWSKSYGIFFYAIAFAFGFIHIANFKDFDYALATLILIPVLTAPQIWVGLLVGYTRVKYGFFWGYFLHVGHNAILFSLVLATMGILKEKLNISNENYVLHVEEHMLHDQTAPSSSFVGPDSIGFQNQKLNDVIFTLLDKDKSLVELDKSRHQHLAINVKFKSHIPSKDIKHSKNMVLEQLKELYNFNISHHSRPIDAWNVIINDSAMLETHAVVDIGRSTVNRSQEHIMFENVTLGDLVNAIETDFKVLLVSRRELLESGKYNFKLPKSDFKKVQEDLKTKYGILLQSKMELADLTVVSFE